MRCGDKGWETCRKMCRVEYGEMRGEREEREERIGERCVRRKVCEKVWLHGWGYGKRNEARCGERSGRNVGRSSHYLCALRSSSPPSATTSRPQAKRSHSPLSLHCLSWSHLQLVCARLPIRYLRQGQSSQPHNGIGLASARTDRV